MTRQTTSCYSRRATTHVLVTMVLSFSGLFASAPQAATLQISTTRAAGPA